MKVEHTERGFEIVRHHKYGTETVETRLVQQSSVATGHFLWVGQDHHLE